MSAHPPHVVKTGDVLPYNLHARYDIGKTLRKGKFAEVKYGASKVKADQIVEVKIVPRGRMKKSDENALAREVEITRSLVNFHVVHMYEFFEDVEHFYIIMEHCTGGDLFDRIVAKTFYEEKDAREVIKTILFAFNEIHARHLVHRSVLV